MARIRTIKPEFWLNEEMATVSSDAALLAIGLLNYADDEGYFNANPMLIKAAIFPIRQTKDIAKVLLPELVKIGYVVAFTDSYGRIYGCVTNFTNHQVINKPKDSKISCLELLQYDYCSGVVGLPTGREGKGRERNGTGSAPSGASIPDWMPLKEWNDWVAIRPSKSNKPETLQKNIEKLDAWRKKGHSVKEILDYSIAGGYQGLFEPKANSFEKPNQSKSNPWAGVKL